RQGFLDALQPQHVGDVAAALHRKNEVVRRFVVPAPEAIRMLQRVEAAVELDGGKAARGVFEFTALRESFGIEVPAPARIAPARDADARATFRHGLPPRWAVSLRRGHRLRGP